MTDALLYGFLILLTLATSATIFASSTGMLTQFVSERCP